MSLWPAWARQWVVLAGVAALGGCAQLPHPPIAPDGPAPAAQEDAAPAASRWSGRLAVRVEEAAQADGAPLGSSFSSAFELQGTAEAGELRLYTPLGATAAVLRWAPGQALLQTGEQHRVFPSLDALVTQVTGAALPVAALFDWLAGTPGAVPGWQVDLSQLPQGRLRAQRWEPAPRTDLRLALDR